MTFKNFVRSPDAFKNRRPFQPFLLLFRTGEAITISHPEAVRPNGEVLMFTAPSGRKRLFDSWSVKQLLELDGPPGDPSTRK